MAGDATPTTTRSPMLHAARVLWAKGNPYSAHEKNVVMAIVFRMNADGVAWPGLKDIASRCDLSVSTVRRTLAGHIDGATPLLSAGWDRAHRSKTYQLIRSPAAFATGRDKSRSSDTTRPSSSPW